MMLPPVGVSGNAMTTANVAPQTQRQNSGSNNGRERADSLEQFFADRRQSHPALEFRPHERRGAASRERRRRHIFDDIPEAILFRLPTLKEAIGDLELHRQLLLQKMRQCQQPVDWEEPQEDEQTDEKTVKAEALQEVIDWLGSTMAGRQLAEDCQLRQELVNIVRANLFRILPPSESAHQEADPEELAGIGLGTRLASGACLEPSWPHLKLVYRLLHLLIQQLDPQQEGGLAALIDGQFVGQLLALFHSEDPREHEQLKEALHALYSRMLPLRVEIRKRMGWLLLSHVYEQQPCRGVPETLEILGDIVNGFNVPLKPEHRQFFLRVLLPLHKPHGYLAYFARLTYCVALFLEKDPSLAKPTFEAILRHWPKSSSAKEILFMAELEELLGQIGQAEFRPICVPLFQQLAKCASSQHCRVAERALQLWNDEKVLALLEPNCHLALPIMFQALYCASEGHWNDTIAALVFKTMKRLMCLNAVLFDELVMNYENEEQKRRKRSHEREQLWRKLSDALEERDNGCGIEVKPSGSVVLSEEKENIVAATVAVVEQPSVIRRRNGTAENGASHRHERRSAPGRRGSADAGRPKKKAATHQQEHTLAKQLAVI